MENTIRTFNQNEVIFREGVYERCMYRICAGSVDVYADYEGESRTKLVTLDAGRCFGEVGLADMRPRTATAVAAADGTKLEIITAETFSSAFGNDPDAVLEILRSLSSRIRALTGDYREACRTLAEAAVSGRGKARSEGLAARLSRLAQALKRPFSVQEPAPYVQNALAADSGAFTLRTFGKNEVIFREGDASECMYVVSWGRVGIYAGYDTQEEKLLTELGPDAFFGEMGLVDDLPRSATAVALDKDTMLQRISAAGFSRFLEEKPRMVTDLVQHMCSRLSELTTDYMAVCRMAAEAAEAADSGKDHEYWAESPIADHFGECADPDKYWRSDRFAQDFRRWIRR